MKKEVMKNNKGFSLVEMIVVIAIMAVLMAVLAPTMLKYVEKTRIQKDQITATEVKNAVEIALSDDEIYDKISGTSDIVVKYKGGSGEVMVESGDTDNTIQREIDTTLKANTEHKITTTGSRTYASDIYIVTAHFDKDKSAYLVSGNWNSETAAASNN